MLPPKPTATREQVSLDGVWLFGLDSRLGESPWTSTLTTPSATRTP